MVDFVVDEVVIVEIEWFKVVFFGVCKICVEMNIVLGKIIFLLLVDGDVIDCVCVVKFVV